MILNPILIIFVVLQIIFNGSENINMWFSCFLYIPFAIILIIVFSLMNILIMPFAYLHHIVQLIITLFNGENKKKNL
jgi:hypothetical protein